MWRSIATVSRRLTFAAPRSTVSRAVTKHHRYSASPTTANDDGGDRQRALQVAGAGDLGGDDDRDQQDRQAGGDASRAVESLARSSGSCVIAAASEP